MIAISVNNISKRFRLPHHKKTTLFQHAIGLVKRQMTYEEFWALKDISFEVERGEAFGIIGRNGSGKSTLLKILARVLYPDSGSVNINGKVASFLELGVGFQAELTAAENIYIYASVLGMSRRETSAVYDQILDFAELRKFEDMKLKNFSSGMYTRLAFSTAVNCNPDIMLVDEALAVGDEAFQKKCMVKIREFKASGKTIILVSHAADMVKRLCDRAMLIHNGENASIGETAKVFIDYSMLNGTPSSDDYLPIAIDWDGNGRQELCIFHKGYWFIDINHNGRYDPNADLQLGPFGDQPGDIPLAIDWDGDGRQELCFFRNGYWFIDINHNGRFDPGIDLKLGPFGTSPADIPLAIDWDGKGRQELCIYRPLEGLWYIDSDHSGTFEEGKDLVLGPFGKVPGDMPLAIDWDGDGRQELCIYRRTAGRDSAIFYIDTNRSGGWDAGDKQLGPFSYAAGDIPAAIDWHGNHRQELCLFRAGGKWLINSSHDGRFEAGAGETFELFQWPQNGIKGR